MMTDYKVFYLDHIPDGNSWNKPFRFKKCLYMIRIEIHSSIVHLADIVWFPGNICSYCTVYNTSKTHSHLKSMTVSVESSVACVWVSCPKIIDMKHYHFHLGKSCPILKQRTEANILSMLSTPASPAMMCGRLLKNDFSCVCHGLVPCYLFSQWITKWTFSHLPSVHYLVL